VSTGVDRTGDNYPPSDWLADTGWPLPTLVDDRDSTALKAVGLTYFPFTVFVDGNGLILARVTGAIPIGDLMAFLPEMG